MAWGQLLADGPVAGNMISRIQGFSALVVCVAGLQYSAGEAAKMVLRGLFDARQETKGGGFEKDCGHLCADRGCLGLAAFSFHFAGFPRKSAG